jgi:hypothetical protein
MGFEPTIPASARPPTCALDCAATGIGELFIGQFISSQFALTAYFPVKSEIVNTFIFIFPAQCYIFKGRG